MTTAFFEPGKTYRHYDEAGEPTTEGLFHCVYAGRAPAAFEHHSETLGVAFGWRQGIGPSGEWEALGAYDTPDFAGWRETRPVDDLGSEPDGCRWCGDEHHHHGTQYSEGIGQHQWAQPTDRQRLERMQERRGQKTPPTSACGERLGDAVCAILGRGHTHHVTANRDHWFEADDCLHADCRECEEPSLYCGAKAADGTACHFIAQHRKSGKPHTFKPTPSA